MDIARPGQQLWAIWPNAGAISNVKMHLRPILFILHAYTWFIGSIPVLECEARHMLQAQVSSRPSRSHSDGYEFLRDRPSARGNDDIMSIKSVSSSSTTLYRTAASRGLSAELDEPLSPQNVALPPEQLLLTLTASNLGWGDDNPISRLSPTHSLEPRTGSTLLATSELPGGSGPVKREGDSVKGRFTAAGQLPAGFCHPNGHVVQPAAGRDGASRCTSAHHHPADDHDDAWSQLADSGSPRRLQNAAVAAGQEPQKPSARGAHLGGLLATGDIPDGFFGFGDDEFAADRVATQHRPQKIQQTPPRQDEAPRQDEPGLHVSSARGGSNSGVVTNQALDPLQIPDGDRHAGSGQQDPISRYGDAPGLVVQGRYSRAIGIGPRAPTQDGSPAQAVLQGTGHGQADRTPREQNSKDQAMDPRLVHFERHSSDIDSAQQQFPVLNEHTALHSPFQQLPIPLGPGPPTTGTPNHIHPPPLDAPEASSSWNPAADVSRGRGPPELTAHERDLVSIVQARIRAATSGQQDGQHAAPSDQGSTRAQHTQRPASADQRMPHISSRQGSKAASLMTRQNGQAARPPLGFSSPASGPSDRDIAMAAASDGFAPDPTVEGVLPAAASTPLGAAPVADRPLTGGPCQEAATPTAGPAGGAGSLRQDGRDPHPTALRVVQEIKRMRSRAASGAEAMVPDAQAAEAGSQSSVAHGFEAPGAHQVCVCEQCSLSLGP